MYMTMIEALETLKSKDVTHLIGLKNESGEIADIDDYIKDVKVRGSNSRFGDNKCFIVQVDERYIIVSSYGRRSYGSGTPSDFARYGSGFDTIMEMHDTFEEWMIARDAVSIAEKMIIKHPGKHTYEEWVGIARAELESAHVEARIAFEDELMAVS